jgi:hypothetical protein
MSDPRDAFVSRIELTSTRVRPFNGFLFLCGGPQDTQLRPLRSVRHLIYNEVTSGKHGDLADRLRLAEDIQDWFRGGTYADLVTLEEHLASLSSVILLVVESAGAIAELGAFSVTKALSERLIAVVAEHHYEQESFIRLGPLNRLVSETGREALVYDWHEMVGGALRENFEKLAPDIDDILAAVRQLLHVDLGEKVFKPNVPAHVMLLICELCDLFGALPETEIKGYIQRLAEEVDSRSIEQYLFLLEKCGILQVKPKGHGRYYHAPKWDTHITFSFTPGERIDRDRVRVDVVEFYKKTQKTRAEVVRLLQGAAA